VRPEQVKVTRQFWLYYQEGLRKLKRITLVANYLGDCAERNRKFLLGDTVEMVLP
jgi:hypothetical protein